MKVVHVLRKPLVGSVAETVLEHGTGALNIGATRIGTEVVPIQRWDDGMKPFGDGAGHPYSTTHVTGRWPANLVLQHLPGCRVVGTQEVGTGVRRVAADGNAKPFDDGRGWNQHSMTRGGQSAPESYGQETVAVWGCEPGCPVRDLEESVGVTSSGRMDSIAQEQTDYQSFGKCYTRRVVSEGGTGFVTRFFKQVGKPDE